jgi:ABC-type amino acid transport substrate-binding protein
MLRYLAASLLLWIPVLGALPAGAAEVLVADPALAASESAPCDRLPPTDLRRICASGKLVVARYEGERPPFFFRAASGEWTGFEVELGRRIAERLGVAYKVRPALSFDQVVDRVATGEADIGISKLSITLARAQRVRFSRPYMTVYQTLLINRLAAPKQEDPFTALDRPEARIGALAGSSYVDYARNEFPTAQVAEYREFDAMMEDVAESRLEAAFVDSARANTWRQSNPQRLIQVRAFVSRERKDQLAFAVNWRDTHLLAWLDLYLESIRTDGSAAELFDRWFVESVGGE